MTNSLDPVRRRTGAVLVCAAFVGALLLGMSAPAQAHAIVQSTEPGIDEVVGSAPERVVMTFSEAVEIALGAIRVYDTNGTRVDEGAAEHVSGDPTTVAVEVADDLPNGTYTVTWRVISADSHPISEAFVFHVGGPGSRPQGIADEVLGGESGGSAVGGALFGGARLVSFSSLILLVGALVFASVLWRRPGQDELVRSPEVDDAFARRWRKLLMWSWTGSLIATLATIVLQGSVAGGFSLLDAITPSVMGDVIATRYGAIALARVALLLAGGAVFVALARGSGELAFDGGTRSSASVGAAAARAPIPSWLLAVTGLWSLALLVTPGLQGHAGTTEPVAVNLTADVVHLAGGAAWIGGLVVLAFAAWPATKQLGETERAAMLAPVVGRFSTAAMISVAAIVVTGTYRSFVEVGAWRALFDTSYGLTLLAKIALFVPLLALGAINQRWLKPRLAEVSSRGGEPLAMLRRLIGGELVLAVAVIAATALLVNLAPARVDAGIEGPFTGTVRLGDDNLDVLVDPNEVGANQVHLTAVTPSGEPVRIKQMNVLFTMPSEDIGPIVGEGKKLAPGHFVLQGNQLSVPGEWSFEIVARLDKFT
ncbi:MAG: copper resistance CopC/CopD family protein, partial [Actinomycetota bacterium]